MAGKKKYKTEEERLEARRRQARERRQKPENKKKDQEYYQKNKKKIKIQHKIWDQKNREHNNQKARERRAANPEKHRKYGLMWYYKNHEKSKLWGKRHYHANKETRLAGAQKWRDKNRERYLKQQKQYNKDMSAEKFAKRLDKRIVVLSYYSITSNPSCSFCKEKDLNFLTIDHIDGVKLDDGRGSYPLVKYLIEHDFPEGYQTLCMNCNWLKHFEIKQKSLSMKKENVMSRAKLARLKNEVFTHYSKGKPKCICCGFDNITALTIDHVSGRKNVQHKPDLNGRQLYYWLRSHNYPKDIQILCIMCNRTKSALPNCPHKKS